MNLAAWIDRLDDYINPIVVKELRQAVQSRMIVGILLLFLGLQVFLLGFFLMTREFRQDPGAVDWGAGTGLFLVQQSILLWTIMLLVPAYAAIRLGAERADHNVDLMFISTLRPWSIVWGKFFANVLIGLLIFSTCAPFMAFTYLLRGIDIPTIASVLFIDLLCMFFGVMLALLLASLPGGRGFKAFLAFLGFVQIVQLGVMMNMLTVDMIDRGSVTSWFGNSWQVPALIVGGVLASIGLMSFYCVGLISPTNSNRVLPLRLYLLVTWLLTTAGVFALSLFGPDSPTMVPLLFYLGMVCPVLYLQLLISLCERDRWGPRVRRSIPRPGLLRLLAWLLYSGSAGGITFSLLLLLASLGSTALVLDWVRTAPEANDAWFLLVTQVFLTLYLFCYGLSAVAVRHYLLAGQLSSGLTWLLALVLLGLGCSIPYTVAYVAFYDQLNQVGDTGWWMLPNPFFAIAQVAGLPWRGGDFAGLLIVFLAGWAVLVSILCLPWYLRQVREFRPMRRREEVRPVVVVPVSVPTAEAT